MEVELARVDKRRGALLLGASLGGIANREHGVVGLGIDERNRVDVHRTGLFDLVGGGLTHRIYASSSLDSDVLALEVIGHREGSARLALDLGKARVLRGRCGPGVGDLGVGARGARPILVRRRHQSIAYARRVATQLDVVKLHLAGAQHGAGDAVRINARAVRNRGAVVVLAVCRHLADEVFALHRVSDGERLLVAYDLGVIGGVTAGLDRAGEPGIGPGAGVSDRFGLGRRVAPVVLGLDLIVHIGPERITHIERAGLRRIRVVLILGVLDEDLGLAGKRRGRSGGNGVLLLRSSRRRSRVLGLSRVVCGGVIAIRSTRICALICVGAIGSSARRCTVRVGAGNSALIGRRALAARRSLGHGLGDALGALGPKLRRRGAKSHGKSQECHQAAFGYATDNRSMTTPRGALALVLKHIHLSPTVCTWSIAQRLPHIIAHIAPEHPHRGPPFLQSPTRTGGMRRGRVQDGRRSDLTLPTRARRPICDATIPGQEELRLLVQPGTCTPILPNAQENHAFVRLRTTI